jgi:hypothetical protein
MDAEAQQLLHAIIEGVKTMSAQLDVIDAKLDAIAPTPARAEYSLKEFHKFCGGAVTLGSLKHERIWRRYGGRKRGGRVVFSEAARLAIAEGRK